MKKFKNYFRGLYEKDIENKMPKMKEVAMNPLKQSMGSDVEDEGEEFVRKM